MPGTCHVDIYGVCRRKGGCAETTGIDPMGYNPTATGIAGVKLLGDGGEFNRKREYGKKEGVYAYLDPEDFEELSSISQETGISLSSLIRREVKRMVRHHKREGSP